METREGGLEAAIRAAGGVGVRAWLGVSQPSVSDWHGSRPSACSPSSPSRASALDLAPDLRMPAEAARAVDEIDLLRAHEYALLAALLARAPDRDLLTRVAALKGDATPPRAWLMCALAEAAASVDPDAISREYFDLFVGVEPRRASALRLLLPDRLPVRAPAGPRPRGSSAARHRARRRAQRTRGPHRDRCARSWRDWPPASSRPSRGAERRFFERHLKPWAARFFADLRNRQARAVLPGGRRVGRLFMEIEAEAFAMDGQPRAGRRVNEGTADVSAPGEGCAADASGQMGEGGSAPPKRTRMDQPGTVRSRRRNA